MRRILGKGAQVIKKRHKGLDIFQYGQMKIGDTIRGPRYGIAVICDEYNYNRLTPKLMKAVLHHLDVKFV